MVLKAKYNAIMENLICYNESNFAMENKMSEIFPCTTYFCSGHCFNVIVYLIKYFLSSSDNNQSVRTLPPS